MPQPPTACRPKAKRGNSLQEVSLGYPRKIGIEEAKRCPQCLDPVCNPGCPLGIDIPGFIRLVREGEASKALEKIKEKNVLSGICGRICPAPCETACVFSIESSSIGIRALERFASDVGKIKPARPQIRAPVKKVAVVGSGPMGLTAAAELAKAGYRVTIFEAMEEPGGILRYGVADFRLPREVLDQEIAYIKALGVEVKTNCLIGKTISLRGLVNDGFSAILLSIGQGAVTEFTLPGFDLTGVYTAEEFLMKFNSNNNRADALRYKDALKGKKLVVLGETFKAMDCARIAARLGLGVTVVFSKTEEEMQTALQDREYAKEEGVKLEGLTVAVGILANERNQARVIKCNRLDYADPDSSGKWQLVPVADSEFVIEADIVLLAQEKGNNFAGHVLFPELKVDHHRNFLIDPQNGMTSMGGVFCAQEFKKEENVVWSIASGKKIAENIGEYLRKQI